MKTKFYFVAALAATLLASCADDTFVGDNSPNVVQDESAENAINFAFNMQNTTRAGEFVGATAADKLGGMFVVEGTKGDEQTASPSTTVVFDNYLVGYEANTAGETESNTHNWEYVGKQTGISGRMEAATWTSLHSGATDAKSQTIKYWDYSVPQYDFIAWSTGKRLAVPSSPVAGTSVGVTRINTGATLATNGFTLTAMSAADLLECYYTDITTVTRKTGDDYNYGKPVTLTFRNMAAKVRVALYETVPGYSVKNVQFYTNDTDPLAVINDLSDASVKTGLSATLFTTGSGVALPQSGAVTVKYPRIGTTNRNASPRPVDYNKASVSVSAVSGGATSTTQAFGTLYNYQGAQSNEEAVTEYLGRNITEATYAGIIGDNYYTAVIPNTDGHPLTLRVNYTLVPIDGAAETITVYGAKAVVPSKYTNWLPNYAYTYIFKISDNSNGWTSTDTSDPAGLFPITFDAMVASFTEANAEQTTVTTVATPSITTYQQGHDHANKNEYSKSQKAGADKTNVKDVYVQVMKTDGTASLYNDLNVAKKSLLFSVSEADASEAEVMDALENRTNAYSEDSPIGRNGITLTKSTHITNGVTTIINGVDDQPISVAANTTAMIDIDQLDAGTYAYVYSTSVPTDDDAIFNVVTDAEATTNYAKYYEVSLTASDGTSNVLTTGNAVENHVYFVKNLDKDNKFVSYTFKQTKIGESVVGLVDGGPIVIGTKATAHHDSDASNKYFYFDVYNKNNGAYAVKVIKVVSGS